MVLKGVPRPVNLVMIGTFQDVIQKCSLEIVRELIDETEVIRLFE